MGLPYKITTRFCWYEHGKMIVKMYFINEIPFTFDELPDGHLWDEELCRIADENRTYDSEDLYKSFGYLVTEEVHPLYFPLELENPEDLPDDLDYYYNEEDLVE
jgi:hypothetical protein